MKRSDDFENRREHLKGLTDEQLRQRFWELAEQVVEPMLELGKKNTTPAIERSVLLRMGFSSLEVGPIVDGAIRAGLMGKGCGNIVWRLAESKGCGIREAGLALASGQCWDEAQALFEKGDAQ